MTAPSFRYTAFDAQGRKVAGVLSASNALDASSQLCERGLLPIQVRAGGSVGRTRGARIGARRCADLLYDLGMLLGAGASITAALSIVRQQAESPALSRVAAELEREITSGRPMAEAFSIALADAPFVPGLLAAGEASGDLGGALRHASEQLQRDIKLRDDLWSALSYPLFILGASVTALLVLLIVVVPALAPLLSQSPDPPVFLQAMFALSAVLKSGGAILLVAGPAAFGVLLIAARQGLLARTFEAFMLDGPFRKVVSAVVYGRFGGLLGRLLSAGVPAP